MIYLIAELLAAEQIIPLLRYYYAGDIPLYALSQLYPARGVDQPNMDLNNVYFCDMPWVLDPSHEPQYLQQLRLQIETIWPDSYSNNKKLYALGIDAYTIATKKLPLTGATGDLSLDQQQHIYRQLLWAQFKDGLPTLTP
jgi:outer membrane PBP1 activator LpoA protein